MDKASVERKFKAMKLPELKKYLQDRGVSVNSYLKPGLVAIACAVEDMKLPLLYNITEEKEQLNVSRRLLVNDIQLPAPFTVNAVNDFKDCPPFGLFDIFNHLIYHSSDYDKQGLAAYKSYEDYRLFHDGYVASLLTHYHKEAGLHMFVGKVKPAMKERTKDGKEFYDLWFVLEGKGANRGSVIDAYCVCLGGRDGGCKHIAAAMYSLEDLLNSKGEQSVTSGPCQWQRKAKPDTTACEVKDLQIVRNNKRSFKDREQDATSANKKSRIYTLSQHIDHDPRMPSDRLPCCPDQLTSLVDSMERMNKKPVILSVLAKQLHGSREVLACGKPKGGDDIQQGIMEQKLISYMETNPKSSAKSFRENLNFTDTERSEVDATTKKQWQCKQWFIHKTGFVTASRVQSVYTRRMSVERHKTDVSLLVESLTNDKKAQYMKKHVPEDPQNPIDWGLKYEDTARKAYYRIEGQKHHQLRLVSKGFIISKQKPFLGASPDNITQCKCKPPCKSVLVEYKCPWSHKDLDPKEAFLQPEIGGVWDNGAFSLKLNSRYYYQVQTLMLVTELDICHLVVWTSKGIFCHSMPIDPSFAERVCPKLDTFWVTYVVPEMMKKLECHIPAVKAADNSEKGASSVRQLEKKEVNVEQLESKGIHETSEKASSKIPAMTMYGYDIYEEDIDTLKPGKLINDTILSVMLSEHCCEFPIVDTLFYSILVGGQEFHARRASRVERFKAAEKYFRADLLQKDYVFIPINRSLHWFLAIIAPRHILLLDSVTWDHGIRTTEFDNISRYLDHLSNTKGSTSKSNRTYHVLKVPQQDISSNNCAVYVSLFMEHFLKDMEKYESYPEQYLAMVHDWFTQEEAQTKRDQTWRTLRTFFSLCIV